MENSLKRILVIGLFSLIGIGSIILYWTQGVSFYTFHALSGLMPIKHVIAHAFMGGEYPLWNPYMIAGAPFHSGIGILDPLLITYLIWDGLPALIVSSYLALLVAGLGMYLYLHKSWSLSITASILGGILYMFNPFFSATSHELPFMAPAIYLPLIFMFYDRSSWHRSIASAFLCGLCLALSFFSGNLESFYFVYIFFFAMQFMRIGILCIELKSLQPFLREWKYLFWACLTPFLFAAVDLLPSIQMIFDSGRSGNATIRENLIFFILGTVLTIFFVFFWDRFSRQSRKKHLVIQWTSFAFLFALFAIHIDWKIPRIDFNLNLFYPNVKLLMLNGKESFQILSQEAGVFLTGLQWFMDPRFIFYIQPPPYLFTLSTLVLFCMSFLFCRRFDLRLYGLFGIFIVIFPYTSLPNIIHHLLGLDVIAYPRVMFSFFFIQALIVAYGFERLVMDQIQWDSQKLIQTASWFLYLVCGIGIAMLSVLILVEADLEGFRALFTDLSSSLSGAGLFSMSWFHEEMIAYSLQYFMFRDFILFLWGLSKYASLIALVLAVKYPRQVWKYIFIVLLAFDVLAGWNYYTFQKDDIRSITKPSSEALFLSSRHPDERVAVADDSTVNLFNFYEDPRSLDIRWNMPFLFGAKTIESAALNLSPRLFNEFWAYEEDNKYTPTQLKKGSSKLYDLMGMNYLLSSQPIKIKKYQEMEKGSRYWIYKNLKALPRFYFPDKLHISKWMPFERLLYDESWDPIKESWIEGDLALQRSHEAPKKSDIEDWSITKETYNTLELNVVTGKPVLLASTESFHPNWKVWVDGVRQKVQRVNFYFKGVFLDPGEHRVRFEYMPDLFKWGVGISIFTFVILSFLIIQERLIKRRKTIS